MWSMDAKRVKFNLIQVNLQPVMFYSSLCFLVPHFFNVIALLLQTSARHFNSYIAIPIILVHRIGSRL